ncbi:MAG: LamG domain-containing protein [Chloroflexi bacterium]|nr:LamG domain-containing protein [Chloroflexota bacterium]
MNGALSFDGVDDRVNVGDDPSLRVSDLTVSAWVRVDGQSEDYETIVSKRSVNYDWDLLLDTQTSKRFLFCVANSAGGFACVGAASQYLIGPWYHVTGTFDGATVELYVDGVSQGTAAFTGSRPYLTSDVTIGVMRQSGTLIRYFEGTIDEVRLYGNALTAQEVLTLYNGYLPPRDPDVAADWRLDEGSGVSISDSSGNANHGSVYGPSWVPGGR